MYTLVSFLILYNFTDNCYRLENQLQLINIISNHTTPLRHFDTYIKSISFVSLSTYSDIAVMSALP